VCFSRKSHARFSNLSPLFAMPLIQTAPKTDLLQDSKSMIETRIATATES